MLCPHCTADERPVLVRNGPHIMATCKVCGKYIKFVAQIPDLDFVMPFGMHKGKKLDLIDSKYLRFIYDHVKLSNRIKRLIEERLKKDNENSSN